MAERWKEGGLRQKKANFHFLPSKMGIERVILGIDDGSECVERGCEVRREGVSMHGFLARSERNEAKDGAREGLERERNGAADRGETRVVTRVTRVIRELNGRQILL